MYPLFFKPIYKSTVWGGRNLEILYDRVLPEGKVGESWEISSHSNDSSIILNGEFKGRTLDYLMKNYKYDLLGKNAAGYDKFPLLIKIIDACDCLSVQVHPGDGYAEKHEHDSGKTEMWYIAYAKENAELVLGLKPGVNSEAFKSAINNNSVEKLLNRISVKEGDVIYIPSGTVHAILDGIVLIEIQQNSDVTYRLYDWNRVDDSGKSRALHIDKALDVINFDYKAAIHAPIKQYFNGYTVEKLVLCEYFNTEKIEIDTVFIDSSKEDSFYTCTVIKGSGELVYNNCYYQLLSGTSFLIPSDCREYLIKGNLSLLKAFI